jgi:hypothetical protein
VFPFESDTVNTCELDKPARIATAIQSPAVFGLTNARVELVVVPASLLVCCTSAIFAGALTRLVKEKFAGLATPVTVAVTVYGPPAVLLAVNVAAVATPLAFVTAVFTPPANVPLAPPTGAVNVTVTPLTGLFRESSTVACNGIANAVFALALCGVPALAVRLAGGPARLVKEKFAAAATPVTVAVTV